MLDARVDLFLDEVFFFRSSFFSTIFLWWSTIFASLYLFLWVPFFGVLWSSSSASFHFHISTNMKVWGGVSVDLSTLVDSLISGSSHYHASLIEFFIFQLGTLSPLLGLHQKPLNADIGRLLAPYRPSSRQGDNRGSINYFGQK